MDAVSHVRRFDHIGITVADLDTVTAFFVWLGLEVENRMFVEGEFLDTVIGIPDSRIEIVMLAPPDGGTRVEISSFARPDHLPGSPAAPANELGLRNVAFEVHDLQAAVDRAASDRYGSVGGIGEYEGYWRMAYVRGSEGIIVSLAERDRLSLPLTKLAGATGSERTTTRGIDDQYTHTLDSTTRCISSAYRKPHTCWQHHTA
jgi:catechol 2,3-dioxygenase-like lactoylglutathione lyase family enzyme